MTYIVEEEELIPENTIFSAVLVTAEEKSIPYVDKKTQENKTFEKIEWKWLIERPQNYSGKHVFGECRPELSTNPSNRFRLIAEALLQRPLPPGTPLSLEDLIGLRADITVTHRVSGERTFVQVDEVMPPADNEPPF